MAVGRVAGENLIFENRIVMQMLERRKEHLLRSVCVNRVDAVAEAFLLVQAVRCKHPDAGVHARIIEVSLGGKEHRNQR